MKKNKYIVPNIEIIRINVYFLTESDPTLKPGKDKGDAWSADSKANNMSDIEMETENLNP